MLADNKDGTWTAQFTPEDVGSYCIIVKYEDNLVPECPHTVLSTPIGDASKCKITGNQSFQ